MIYTEVTKIDGVNRLVRSNELTSASYTLPPDAHRILSVAMSMIRQEDKQLHTYRIYARQLVAFFPALQSDKNAIARLDKATDALMGSYIKIRKENGWLKRNLIHSCVLNRIDGAAYVEIRLDDDMVPFLIGLSGGFSAPKIENIRHFKKENHFKLYSFFYAHLYRGSTGEVPLSHIRELLSIQKKQYTLIGHLKSRLLSPTIDLINRTTDIRVDYIPYKHGKKIAGFIFDIKKNRNINPFVTSSDSPDNELSKKYFDLGVKGAEFEILLKKHGSKYLNQLHSYVLEKKKRNFIGSVKGYIFGILKNEPPIENLLLDSCKYKNEQAKVDRQKKQQLEQEKQESVRREKENRTIAKLVDKYLSKLNDSQLLKLKTEFGASVYGKGLKLGKDQLDFTSHLVDASFKRYVYRKHIKYSLNA